ncbi:MAG: PBP1A family penicillin-binding protein [Coriobacteriia bacterium]|nr:PBP1A family penicillin-binding protein [Coriobacteriia bacterium]
MSVHNRKIRPTTPAKSKGNGKIIALTILGIFLLLLIAGGVIGSVAISKWLENLPDYKAKNAFQVARPTTIYSSDGKLLARLYLENREVISIDKMSPYVLNATVAVEDERFYKHHGVDFVGIMRSVFSIMGGTRQGGSTITQQYIRNTILRDEATDMSLRRKVREAYLALQIEKVYTKKEILSMYLNTVYFGEGAYGIQAAAQTYFSKNANKLTIAQAAMLAGLPQRPSGTSPFDNPDGALSRRNQVLRRMLSNNYLTKAEYDKALAEKISPKRSKEPTNGIYAYPYFVAQVKKDLQKKFSKGTVFEGGLKVVTTLDTKMQKSAEKAVKKEIGKKGPEGALVAIEPSTGEVKALVGGRSYTKNQFNMATQAHRQAGSSFKTFTLAAAIDDGMSPSIMVDSSSPATIPTTPPWIVHNSEGQGHGMISLASATYSSVNAVYARVCYALGAEKVVKMAHKLGITTKLKAYPSITLGAQNVTPLEMASGYATLADNGVYNTPTFIKTVTDREGKNIYRYTPENKRVISASVAATTTKVLRGVVTGGTGTQARLSGRQVAGKTGTSQKNRDVWFCGYTPQLATAIWVGYPQEKTIIMNGSLAFGGSVCGPIFHDFMTVALEGMPAVAFKTADQPSYDNSKYNLPKPKVENVSGNTLDVAIKKLKGYTIDIVKVWSDKTAGTVLSQKVSGNTVTLTVSKGIKPPPDIKPSPDIKPPPGNSNETTSTANQP